MSASVYRRRFEYELPALATQDLTAKRMIAFFLCLTNQWQLSSKYISENMEKKQSALLMSTRTLHRERHALSSHSEQVACAIRC